MLPRANEYVPRPEFTVDSKNDIGKNFLICVCPQNCNKLNARTWSHFAMIFALFWQQDQEYEKPENIKSF